MSPPVFISYARKTSRPFAEQLHTALGPDEAFLDTSDIEAGDRFEKRLADALLGSRVVVLFADETYFRRWYCLWELRTVLAPYLHLRARASDTERNAALAPIVIARPAEGSLPAELRQLPPLLRNTHWPRADEVLLLARLVRERLEPAKVTLAERIDAAGGSQARTRAHLLEDSALPPPMNLAAFEPLYPRHLPTSLEDAFKGRADELWRIDFTLSTSRGDALSGAALTGALEGGGGFGKTRLALEYLHRLGPRHFPGGIFWVDADKGEDQLEEQFHGVLQTLRPEVPDLATYRRLGRKVDEELAEALDAAARKGAVLYIVDNIPEPSATTPPRPLKTWCPALGRVTVLATSRAKLSLDIQRVHPLPVDALSREAAVALLTDGVPEASPDDEEWARIATWVGYLPLALELLNRALRASAVTRAELLERLDSGPVRELDRQRRALHGVPVGGLRGVTEALSVSYEALPESTRRVARLLAHLAPNPIPLVLVDALGTKDSMVRSRALLDTRHFVTQVPSVRPEVPLFGSMHRVLADFLRSRSTKRFEELSFLRERILRFVHFKKGFEPETWSRLDACLPHAEQVFEHLQRCPGKRTRAQARKEIELGFAIGVAFSTKGLWTRARDLESAVLARSRKSLGPEHPDTLGIMSFLAEVLRSLGQYPEAHALQKKTWKASLRVLGPEDSRTLLAMNNLALILSTKGELQAARELQEQALAIGQRLLGEKHPLYIKLLTNLGQTLFTLGDYPRARALQERGLKLSEQLLGKRNPTTLLLVNNLALVLYAQEEWETARKLLAGAEETYRGLLGEEHPEALKMMGNLAEVLRQQGALPEALELARRAALSSEHVLGAEHPDTLSMQGILAHCLVSLGRYQEAHDLQARVLEALRRLLGEQHPTTLSVMANLASTLHVLGDIARSRDWMQRALEISQCILGEENHLTLALMFGLIQLLTEEGWFQAAQALQEQELAVCRRKMGAEHPETLVSLRGLALLLLRQGEPRKTRLLAERVLETCRRVFGEADPDTLEMQHTLGLALSALGEIQKAMAMEEHAVAASRSSLGEQHPTTLESMAYLALHLLVGGRQQESQTLAQQVLSICEQSPGEPYSTALLVLDGLVMGLAARELYREAQSLQERLLELRRRILGAEHPRTRITEMDLTQLRTRQEKGTGPRLVPSSGGRAEAARDERASRDSGEGGAGEGAHASS